MLTTIKDLVRKYPKIEQLSRSLISLSPLSHRLGKDFWAWYAFLEHSEYWSLEKLENWQFSRLRILLLSLIETSAFYRERLTVGEINKITNSEQFSKIVSVLRRQEYVTHFSKIVSNRDYKNRKLSSTSGTTGSALQFYTSRKLDAIEWASICHQWKRVGYIPGISRRAEFRGLTSTGQLYECFADQNMVRFSILNINSGTLPLIAKTIMQNALDFFHGYPSAIYLLARTVLMSEMSAFPQPKAILLASEMVYETQLEMIKLAFPKSQIYAHYGCAERTILAGWCEKKEHYHPIPQYGITEFDSITGELIGTNLHNEINGFVRYAMTDTAERGSSNCEDCNRAYLPVISQIKGRIEDYLYTRESGWIPPAIITYPLKGLKYIQELQFRQKTLDLIEINYVQYPNKLEHDVRQELNDIEKGLRRITGNNVNLHFNRVEYIARGKTGKFKWIVSELDPKNMMSERI